MKDSKSAWSTIFTIIGIFVVLVSAVALLFVYREKLRIFLSKVKNFVIDLKNNFSSTVSLEIESCEYYDEYEDFADV